MDDRCEKFSTDAKAVCVLNGNASQPQRISKEVGKLCKFLQRNQEQRLTEKGQSKLFDAVRTYYKHAKLVAGDANITPDDKVKALDMALNVVKDGLAMPFNIFGSKHKQSMLKWHDELTGLVEEHGGEDEAAAPAPVERLQVLDIDSDGYLSLMNDGGEMVDGLQVAKKTEHFASIKQSYEESTVYVYVRKGAVIEVKCEDE